MRTSKHFLLAALFGAFSAIVATVVYLIITALMGTTIGGAVLLSAAFDGIAIFIVGFLTVLFVWPRIGFDPFDSHPRKTT